MLTLRFDSLEACQLPGTRMPKNNGSYALLPKVPPQPTMAVLASRIEQMNQGGSDDLRPGRDSLILVLEPLHRPGADPILLDQAELSIGSGDDCAVRLPANGTHAKHGVIIRGAKGLVLKASDRRTWLNGYPVTEAPLREGDRVAFGPVEFRLRRATANDLLQAPLAAPHSDRPVAEAAEPERVLLDSGHSLLAAVRALLEEERAQVELPQLTDQIEASPSRPAGTANSTPQNQPAARQFDRARARLESDFAELDQARSQLEAERSQFEQDLAQFESERQVLEDLQSEFQTEAERLAADRSQADIERLQLDSDRFQLDAERTQFEEEVALCGAQSADVESLRAECEAEGTRLEAERTQIEAERLQFESERFQIETERSRLEADLARFAEARAGFESHRARFAEETRRLDAERTRLDADQKRANPEREHFTTTMTQLAAKRAEIEAARQELETQQSAFQAERARLDAKHKQESARQSEREAGDALIEEELSAIETARCRLDSDRAQLDTDRLQFESELGRLKDEQTEGQRRLDAERAELEKSRAQFKRDQAHQAATREQLDRDCREIETARAEWEARRREHEEQLTELAAERDRIAGERALADARENRLIAADSRAAAERADLEAARRQFDLARANWETERDRLESELRASAAEREEIAAARDRFAAEQEQLATQRAAFVSQRDQFAAGRPGPAEECRAGSSADALAAGELLPPAEAAPIGPEFPPETRNWGGDVERFSRLFRPHSRGAGSPPADSTPPQPAAPAVDPQPATPSNEEHPEVAASIAAFMERLLHRKRPGGIPPQAMIERKGEWTDDVDWKGLPAEKPVESPPIKETDAVADETPPEQPPAVSPRARHNVHEIRAGVGSLREIANLSARSAVAKHSSKKLRKSFALMLPLAILAFLVGSAMIVAGGSEGRFYYHALGAMLIGLVTTLELLRSSTKAWRLGGRKPGAFGVSGDRSSADRPATESADHLLAEVPTPTDVPASGQDIVELESTSPAP